MTSAVGEYGGIEFGLNLQIFDIFCFRRLLKYGT